MLKLNKPLVTGKTIQNAITRIRNTTPIYNGPDAGKLKVFIEVFDDQTALDRGQASDIQEIIITTPATHVADIHAGLRALPQFTGATDYTPPTPAPAPIPPVVTPV